MTVKPKALKATELAVAQPPKAPLAIAAAIKALHELNARPSATAKAAETAFEKKLERYVIDQLGRASFSVPLNIAEGSGKFSKADRKNYFTTARASLFECVAVLVILVILLLILIHHHRYNHRPLPHRLQHPPSGC